MNPYTIASLNHHLNVTNTQPTASPQRILYTPQNSPLGEAWLADTQRYATYCWPNVTAAAAEVYKNIDAGTHVQQTIGQPQTGKADKILLTTKWHADAYTHSGPIGLFHSAMPHNTLREQNWQKVDAANLGARLCVSHLKDLERNFDEYVKIALDCTRKYRTPFLIWNDESQKGIGEEQLLNAYITECGGDLSRPDQVSQWDNPLLRVNFVSGTPTMIYDPHLLSRIQTVYMPPGEGYVSSADLLQRPNFLDAEALGDFLTNDGAVLRYLLDRSYAYYAAAPRYSHVVVRLKTSHKVDRTMSRIIPDWARRRGLDPAHYATYAYGDNFENPQDLLRRISTTPRYETCPENPLTVHLVIQSIAEGINVDWTYIAGWHQEPSKQTDTEEQRVSRPCGYGEAKRTNHCPITASKRLLENYVQDIVPALGQHRAPQHVAGPSTWITRKPNPDAIRSKLITGVTDTAVRQQVIADMGGIVTNQTSKTLHLDRIGSGTAGATGISTTDTQTIVRNLDAVVGYPTVTHDPAYVPVYVFAPTLHSSLWQHPELDTLVMTGALGVVTLRVYLTHVQNQLPHLAQELQGNPYFSRVPVMGDVPKQARIKKTAAVA